MSNTKIDKIKLESLFEKLKILNYKYEKLGKTNSFNLFSILLNKYDEVNLHSKFIAEILNPSGTHNFKTKFLESFINQIGVHNFIINGSSVETEYRKIDILIKNTTTKQAIIIENKIYAGDQERQLERYSGVMKGEGYDIKGIYYLTLDGREANKKSIGELNSEDVTSISYRNEIVSWVERCIEISALIPSIRETFTQYLNLIKELTNQSYMEEHIKDLMELLEKEDNAKEAKGIADNWVHIRWHTEYNFWNELENRLSSQYEILDNQKWSGDYLTRVIHYSRNRDFWYGLMFDIYSIGEYSFRCFIERGYENLYYGLVLFNKDERVFEIKKENERSWAKKVEDMLPIGTNNFFLCSKYIDPSINFESFNSQAANLINPKKRKIFINEIVKEIEDFVKNSKSRLT